MTKNNASKQVAKYVLLVFLFSIPFYYLIAVNGDLENRIASLYVFPLMWMPAVAGVITTLIYQRNLRGMGWGLRICDRGS